MPHRRGSIVILVALLVATTFVTAHKSATPTNLDPQQLIAHEWGTFTSIAAPDGSPVQWVPQRGSEDLPCFVQRMRVQIKGWLPGTVRMETPVIYFYAPENIAVDVRVRFREGVVSEWFPKAEVTPATVDAQSFRRPGFESSIAWTGVKVTPGAPARFTTESGPNHYYAARETDAAPLQVGSETERFLFYRGIGSFVPPIAASLTADNTIKVRTQIGQPLGDLIVFESRGGKSAYRIHRGLQKEALLPLPTAAGTLASLRKDLEQILVSHGLYKKEAAAMVATWRDSWFEEGSRLFYVVPKAAIDEVLPLDITPKPKEVARVFVGRIELVTPATLQEVKQALVENDGTTLMKYGRFLAPIADRLFEISSFDERASMKPRLSVAYSGAWLASAPKCN